MGKKYFVEEIDEFEWGFIVAPIAVILGILFTYHINCAFFDLLRNLFHNLKGIDAESAGILIGFAISILICLLIFIKHLYKGYDEAICYTSSKIVKLNCSLMILGAILLPLIIDSISTGKFHFHLWDFLIALILQAIAIILSLPISFTINIFLCLTLGTLFAIPIYYILLKLKARQIKKTLCWQKMKEYFQEENIKEQILNIKIYTDRIEFFGSPYQLKKIISFKKLGYSDLKPILKLALWRMIVKETSTPFKIESRFYDTNGYGLILVNKSLRRKNKKEMKQVRKKEKRMDRLFKKVEIQQERKKQKEYEKAVKEGKDW